MNARRTKDEDTSIKKELSGLIDEEKGLIRLYLCGAFSAKTAVPREIAALPDVLVLKLVREKILGMGKQEDRIFLTGLGRDIAIGAVDRFPEEIAGILSTRGRPGISVTPVPLSVE